jgi:uncharacterized protein YkwD
MIGAGTIGGSGAVAPMSATAAAGAAPLAYAATVTTGAASGGAASARTQELMSGAAPRTQAERAWVAQVEQALSAYVNIVGAIVTEAQRQAQAGISAFGVPAVGGTEDHAYEQRVLELVNVERARYGLQPLRYQAQLDAASERHNAVQAATGIMAHDGIGDGDPGSRIRATGFTNAWGENVATGQLSPEQVVAEWMASPGHRKNILDPTFSKLGVSYTVGAGGRTFWAQSFGS